MQVSLIVDLNDPDDVREAQRFLAEHGAARRDGNAIGPIEQLRARNTLCWRMIYAAAQHLPGSFTLNDIAHQMGVTPRKVKSLRAILSKPERRTGVTIFRSEGDGRYTMPDEIRAAILGTNGADAND